MISHKNFLHFGALDTMYRWSMMKNIHSQNLVGIGSWGPEIWPHECLISPIKISVNWRGSKHYEAGQFTLISMGLIRYLCGHISSHHKPIHVKVGVWRFLVMFYWICSWKCWNAKKKIWWRHTSVLYSLSGHSIHIVAELIKPRNPVFGENYFFFKTTGRKIKNLNSGFVSLWGKFNVVYYNINS